MGFISGLLDFCDKAAQQIANEKRASEWNRRSGMTTKERMEYFDNLDLFCILNAPSSSGIALREKSAAKSMLVERGFSSLWSGDSYNCMQIKEICEDLEREAQFLKGTYSYEEYRNNGGRK